MWLFCGVPRERPWPAPCTWPQVARKIHTKKKKNHFLYLLVLLLLLWFSFMVFVTSSTDFKREKYQTHGGWTYVGVSWLTIFTSHSNWEMQLWWGEFVVRLYGMTPKSTVRWNVISGGTLLHPPPIHNTWKTTNKILAEISIVLFQTFLGFCGSGVVCVCLFSFTNAGYRRTSGRSLSDLEWRGPVSSRITPHYTAPV